MHATTLVSQGKQEWTLHGQIKKQRIHLFAKYKPCTFQLQQQTTQANNLLQLVREKASKNVTYHVNQVQIKVKHV